MVIMFFIMANIFIMFIMLITVLRVKIAKKITVKFEQKNLKEKILTKFDWYCKILQNKKCQNQKKARKFLLSLAQTVLVIMKKKYETV
jgi:hypothetical protein